jgi:uncharacterized membrane protein YgcG
MAGIEVDTKRIEFISNMSQSLVETDEEGNEVPFFSMKFLIMKYLKMSDADLELNEKYKFEEKIEKGEAESEEEEGGDEEMGGGDEGGGDEGGGESDGGDEGLDAELLGDVEPE